jgi:hypothetical protein
MTRPIRAVRSAPLAALALLVLALALTACGGGGGDTIRGTVTMGGEPAEGLPVELLEGGEEEPVPGEEGVVVDSTTTDAEGAFAFDAEAGEYSVNVKDLPMEGTGGCVVLVPFVSVGEDSTPTLSLDVPTEPPSGGITFIDPFWFACFEA